MKSVLKDETGNKYGDWIVLKCAPKYKYQSAKWICRCKCGKESIVRGSDLRNGKSKNCGCVTRNRFKNMIRKHGLDGTRINRIYWSMKERCYNQNHHKYSRYGGRGITMCDAWKNDFMAFYNWAIANGYKDNLTIDRINNNGNYEPSNCRWATTKEQANNTSRNIRVSYKGITHTVAEWAKFLCIDYEKLRIKIHKIGAEQTLSAYLKEI